MEQPGFIIYKNSAEMVDQLSNQEAGKLFKAIFAYKADGANPDGLSVTGNMVFLHIKSYLDRDAERFQAAHKNDGT